MWNSTQRSRAPRAGDAYNTAYDPASGKVYDGFVVFAASCTDDLSDPDYCEVDAKRPMEVPMSVVGGTLDPVSGLGMVQLAGKLLAAGADIGKMLRIYQLRSIPHDWDEIWEGTPHLADELNSLGYGSVEIAGKIAPVAAAVLDDMVRHLRTGCALLPGRIDGHLETSTVDGQPQTLIAFRQHRRLPGTEDFKESTTLAPFVDESEHRLHRSRISEQHGALSSPRSRR